MGSKHHTWFFLEVNIFLFPKKITSVGSSAFQKNLQRLDQPTLVIFFGNEKKMISKKKIQLWDLSGSLIP